MIDELKNIVELATSLTVLTGEILKLKPNNKNAEDDEIIIANKNHSAKIGSSGYSAQIGSSGNSAQIGSSGDSAKIGSSGNYAQIGSSGDHAKIGSSGDSAKIGSSGDAAKIDITGNDTVACGIGKNTIIKGKLGTWITLAEYNQDNKPICVKSAQVDGKSLKEDVYYILLNGEFNECVEIDGIMSIVLKKHKNVYLVQNLGSTKKSYIVKDGDIYSHGDTVKEAKESLIYKISNRDTSKYTTYSLNTKLTKKEAIEMYRVITGACEAGTRYFVENNIIPEDLTVKKVIDITVGQYGNESLKEFFNVRKVNKFE